MDICWIHRGSRFHTALPVVHGGDIELVLVPVEVDLPVDQPDHAGVRLNPEQTGGGGATDEAKGDTVPVLCKRFV